MKQWCIALLAILCIVMPVAVLNAENPSDISHVAADGSYRDNVRGVWVDACGKEHPLCPKCPEQKDCPKQETCEDVTEIKVQCDYSNYKGPLLTQKQIEAILIAMHEPFQMMQDSSSAKFSQSPLDNFSISPVIGKKDFRGLQARYKFFGLRIGEMDVSEMAEGMRRDSFEQALRNANSRSNNDSDSDDDDNSSSDGDSDSDSEDDSDSDSNEECTTICRVPGGNISNQFEICVDPDRAWRYLYGDNYEGHCNKPPCEGPECDPTVTCQNGNTCSTITPLGWKRTDDKAKTIEAFVYLDQLFKKNPEDCLEEENKVKPLCRLGAYVGGGFIGFEEQQLEINNETGKIYKIDDRLKIKPTATVGIEYTFPFRLVIGIAWHSEADKLVYAGYGIKF